MNLLAISTSSNACSVTLVSEGNCYTRHEIVANQHTQLILPMIDSVLAEAGVTKQQLNAIAVDEGPGSFTGLRIGMGVAQGMALGLNLPIYPISSLQALALQTNLSEGIVYAAIDARMSEAYWAKYEVKDHVLHTASHPQLSPMALLNSLREDQTAMFVGTAFQDVDPLYPHSQAIAQLALRQIKQGKLGVASSEAKPVYLRDNVALKSQNTILR